MFYFYRRRELDLRDRGAQREDQLIQIVQANTAAITQNSDAVRESAQAIRDLRTTMEAGHARYRGKVSKGSGE